VAPLHTTSVDEPERGGETCEGSASQEEHESVDEQDAAFAIAFNAEVDTATSMLYSHLVL
jgi:hypothetical protein